MTDRRKLLFQAKARVTSSLMILDELRDTLSQTERDRLTDVLIRYQTELVDILDNPICRE